MSDVNQIFLTSVIMPLIIFTLSLFLISKTLRYYLCHKKKPAQARQENSIILYAALPILWGSTAFLVWFFTRNFMLASTGLFFIAYGIDSLSKGMKLLKKYKIEYPNSEKTERAFKYLGVAGITLCISYIIAFIFLIYLIPVNIQNRCPHPVTFENISRDGDKIFSSRVIPGNTNVYFYTRQKGEAIRVRISGSHSDPLDKFYYPLFADYTITGRVEENCALSLDIKGTLPGIGDL
ncbi:MAG: hypothetical protein KKA05_05730 [Alphaproteobacteria bacterium]|nr:hypothetical protein [Alphaproteobacteria bacterium]MBU0859761.1 hypothetical protein [Alphaproteobacteria bacterium]